MSDAIAGPAAAGKRSAGSAFGRAALLLAVATAIAIAGTAAIAAFVVRADFLTGAAELVHRAAFAHGALAAALAASPVVAALLVGYAYMQRGLRRRAAGAAGRRASQATFPAAVPSGSGRCAGSALTRGGAKPY